MSFRSPQDLSSVDPAYYPQGNAPVYVQPMPQQTQRRRYNIYQSASNITAYVSTVWLPSQTPTPEELVTKAAVKEELNMFIQHVFPGSCLVSFGSTANNFALKDSDMDLCCLLSGQTDKTRSQMVELFGAFLDRESRFKVKSLPYARIPIIKLSLPKSAQLPNGLACDIGFENRVALENTRMLSVYSVIDPRVVPIVLFVKAFVKKRRINSPYHGTLSSYGYVLMTLFHLVHVAKPPVLPNLQRFRPRQSRTLEGCDISFCGDVDALREKWVPRNKQSVGELLVDFFRYFAFTYMFHTQIISLRSASGILKRGDKGWWLDSEMGCNGDRRALNKLCIEDPFQTDSNVARTVTSQGLYLMRGEIKRAWGLLNAPDANVEQMMAGIFEERLDDPPEAPRRSSHPGDRGTPNGFPSPWSFAPRRASEPPSHGCTGRETQLPPIHETTQMPPFLHREAPFPPMGYGPEKTKVLSMGRGSEMTHAPPIGRGSEMTHAPPMGRGSETTHARPMGRVPEMTQVPPMDGGPEMTHAPPMGRVPETQQVHPGIGMTRVPYLPLSHEYPGFVNVITPALIAHQPSIHPAVSWSPPSPETLSFLPAIQQMNTHAIPFFDVVTDPSRTSQPVSPLGTLHALPPPAVHQPPVGFYMPCMLPPNGMAHLSHSMLPNGLTVAGSPLDRLVSLGMPSARDFRPNMMSNGHFNPAQEPPRYVFPQGLGPVPFPHQQVPPSAVPNMAPPVMPMPPAQPGAPPIRPVEVNGQPYAAHERDVNAQPYAAHERDIGAQPYAAQERDIDAQPDVPQEYEGPGEESLTNWMTATRVITRRHSWDDVLRTFEYHDPDDAPEVCVTPCRPASEPSLRPQTLARENPSEPARQNPPSLAQETASEPARQNPPSQAQDASEPLAFYPEDEPEHLVYARRILNFVTPIPGFPGFYKVHGDLPPYEYIVSREYGIFLGEYER